MAVTFKSVNETLSVIIVVKDVEQFFLGTAFLLCKVALPFDSVHG